MTLSLEKAYALCEELTIKADSNFALGFRFLPKPKRDAIYALYAFNRLADDFADEVIYENERLDKLEKWELMLEDCYKDKAEHPVMVAFSDAIKRYNIPVTPFKDAIDGFKMDLHINRYKTFEELSKYCDKVAGTISTMSLHVFGSHDAKAFEFGNDLSYALQLTNIIRDVGKDIDKNRIYLPIEDLERFNYSEEELLARKNNENFFRLMEFQIQRAEEFYRRANALIPLIPSDSRFTVLIMGSVYAGVLAKIKKSGIPVLNKEVKLSRFEKLNVMIKKKIKPKFV